VPLSGRELGRFARANFGQARQVRELFSCGLETLWHGYDPLVAPIGAWADPDDHVILLPHGPLHYLPLHALRIHGQYLAERNSVSYAPSASVLRACRSATRRGAPHGGASAGAHGDAVVFGDPTEDLPHARAEAVAVAGLLGTPPLLGDAVTRERFLSSAATADIVHYAGHARFDPNDPMGSGLRLAAGQDLTARQVAGHSNVSASLVTLSGCETGVSLRHPGDELIGLVRGFLQAGTPTMLTSLWRVSDEATAHLMMRFYEHVRVKGAEPRGTTAAEALRQAIRQTREHDGWSSWYYWLHSSWSETGSR
jgi:CHAT domain-containing protein